MPYRARNKMNAMSEGENAEAISITEYISIAP